MMNGNLNRVKRAWLITWEYDGSHAEVKDRFVGIFHWGRSDSSMKKIVEQIYVNKFLNYFEQLSYIKSKKTCPYQVQYDTVFVPQETQDASSLPSTILFGESMRIGSNPYLWARVVHNLEAWIDEDSVENLKWRERGISCLGRNGIESDWSDAFLKRMATTK